MKPKEMHIRNMKPKEFHIKISNVKQILSFNITILSVVLAAQQDLILTKFSVTTFTNTTT